MPHANNWETGQEVLRKETRKKQSNAARNLLEEFKRINANRELREEWNAFPTGNSVALKPLTAASAYEQNDFADLREPVARNNAKLTNEDINNSFNQLQNDGQIQGEELGVYLTSLGLSQKNASKIAKNVRKNKTRRSLNRNEFKQAVRQAEKVMKNVLPVNNGPNLLRFENMK